MRFSIYRFDPEKNAAPQMQEYTLDIEAGDKMLLDALILLKAQDDSLSFRRSCREGVCGSDALNVNGKNRLACVTPLYSLAEPIVIRPLPGLPVIRDLVVDMTLFYQQYERIKPYLITKSPPPDEERLQTPQERKHLEGFIDCILCACCSTACPSFWWNPDKFVGPAGLLQAARFLFDSRDEAKDERLALLADRFSVFRCRSVMNCVDVCPKELDPNHAIALVRSELVKASL